jgi:D-beta-D-heptose 7-phosphate kinase/D-beta-D-heptose 1-phosphate adenosyltransferase
MSLDLVALVGRFAGVRACVVGETMLDSYVTGTTNRLTREAPAPVVDVVSRLDAPGGAANTAANVASLGAVPALVSVVGMDPEGDRVVRAMRARRVPVRHVRRLARRATLTKQRVIAGPQMLARVDSGDTSPLDAATCSALAADLEALLDASGVVIVSDYGYGVVCGEIMEVLGRWRRDRSGILVVDARDPGRYRDLHPSMVKPNYAEALRLLGASPNQPPADRAELVAQEGQRLCELTGARTVAVTLDTEGALVIEDDGTTYRTYAEAAPFSRAAGAGDTFTAAFALALAVGAEPGGAAEIASAASRLVVRREGTTTCSSDELRTILSMAPRSSIGRSRERSCGPSGRRADGSSSRTAASTSSIAAMCPT